MSDAQLKIIIGADVQQAVTGLGKMQDSFDATNLTIDQAIKELDKFYITLSRSSDPASIAGYESSIAKLEARIAELKDQALQASVALKTMTPALSEVSVGSDGLLNTLVKQRIAFQDLGRVVTGQGFSLRTFSSNFALLGPVATIAAFALYEVGKALFAESDAAKKADDNAKKLKQTLLDLATVDEISEKSSGSAAGDISKVQALADVIRDTNNSYEQRKNALEQLHEANKAYFGDLTLEQSSLALLTQKVDEYSKALIAQAITKGYVEEIAKVTSEYNKQKDVLAGLGKSYEDASQAVIDAQKKSKNTPVGAGGDLGVVNAQTQAQRLKDKYVEQNNAVATLQNTINGYTDSLQKSIVEETKFKPLNPDTSGNKYAEALKQLQDYINKAREVDLSAEDKELAEDTDHYNKLAVLLKGHYADLEKLNAAHSEAQAGIIQKYYDKEQEKIVEYEQKLAAKGVEEQQKGLQKIAELRSEYASKDITVSATPRDKEIEQETVKYQKLIDLDMLYGSTTLDDQTNLRKAIQAINDKYDQSDYEKLQEQLDKISVATAKEAVKKVTDRGGADTSPDVINAKKAELDAEEKLQVDAATKSIKNESDLQDAITAIHKEYNQKRNDLDTQAAEKLANDINKILSTGISSGLSGIGEAIGNAIGSGKDPIKAAGESILSAIGDIIEQIGKSLIEYGIVKEELDTVLEAGIALPGVEAIAIGAAAVAIGALVKSVSTHAFASGGIVTGPTLGLVGEAGPEVIFPLEKLNQFVKNIQPSGSQVVKVVGQIQGRNINIVSARDNKLQGMTGTSK